jgi:hypothetical protein
MQARAVLFFSLFDRENAPAQACQLAKFLLDLLQPFEPLAVGHLSLGAIAVATLGAPVETVQLLDVRDLSAKTRNLFTKYG